MPSSFITRYTILTLCCLLYHGEALTQTATGAFSKPTFDCAKVSAPLPVAICSSEDAAAADWELSSAFWALFSQTSEPDQKAFTKAQEDFFQSVLQQCVQPNGPTSRPKSAQTSCIANMYRGRAANYRLRLTSDVLIEASSSPIWHKTTQQALIALGFLSGEPDGVFGLQTRRAIKQFQSANRLGVTGYLPSDQRHVLLAQSEKISQQKSLEQANLAKDATQTQTVLIPTAPPRVAPDPPAPSQQTDSPPPSLQKEATEATKPSSLPSIKEADDYRSCSDRASENSTSACTRLIASGLPDVEQLVGVITRRAAGYEKHGKIRQALDDHNSVLLLDANSDSTTTSRSAIERLTAKSSVSTAVLKEQDGAHEQVVATNSRDHPSFELSPKLVAFILIGVTSYFLVGKLLLKIGLIRLFGIGAGAAAIFATAAYLNSAQSLSEVPAVARHIPLTSQAHLLIPDLNGFLATARVYFRKSANLVDVDRVTNATRSRASDIQQILAQARSQFLIEMQGKDYPVANGCLDFANEPDRRLMGLLPDTAAAGFITARSKSSPIGVIGPLDRSAFSAFLANSSSRFLVDLSVDDVLSSGQSLQLTLESRVGTDFRICSNEHGTLRDLTGTSALQIDASHPHFFATLDPIRLS
jgi:uncharacterized protein